MKIEKEAYICQRCSQVCFDPIDIPFANRSPSTLCYDCFESAVNRSGGWVVSTDGARLVVWREDDR